MIKLPETTINFLNAAKTFSKDVQGTLGHNPRLAPSSFPYAYHNYDRYLHTTYDRQSRCYHHANSYHSTSFAQDWMIRKHTMKDLTSLKGFGKAVVRDLTMQGASNSTISKIKMVEHQQREIFRTIQADAEWNLATKATFAASVVVATAGGALNIGPIAVIGLVGLVLSGMAIVVKEEADILSDDIERQARHIEYQIRDIEQSHQTEPTNNSQPLSINQHEKIA